MVRFCLYYQFLVVQKKKQLCDPSDCCDDIFEMCPFTMLHNTIDDGLIVTDNNFEEVFKKYIESKLCLCLNTL